LDGVGPGTFGVVGEQQGVQERRPTVVLPGELVPADRVGERLGDMDLQVRGHGQQSGVEGHVVAGAGGQAAPRGLGREEPRGDLLDGQDVGHLLDELHLFV
jgi:hypothetical protein